MFQYTKEVIINSLSISSDAYGSGNMVDRIQATPGFLRILRSGEYKLENIVDKRIYKTPGYGGINAIYKLDTALTTSPTTTFAKVNGIYRITINTKMNNKFLAEYANANWYPFGKPIIVEFEVTAANNNPIDLAKLIKDSFKLAIPYNNISLVISGVNSEIIFTATDPYCSFESVVIEHYDLDDYKLVTEYTNQLKNNKEPFATGEWIQENLRFPSYPNVRYNSVNGDELPIPGALYTQYTLTYRVPRQGYVGIDGVGQSMEAVTTHTYYVLNSLVSDFDEKLENAFGKNSIVENYTVIILGNLTLPLDANDGITTQLIYDVYPATSTTAEWKLVAPVTGVTLTTDGKITVANTVTVGTTIDVKCTVADTKYSPAQVTFEVIAG